MVYLRIDDSLEKSLKLFILHSSYKGKQDTIPRYEIQFIFYNHLQISDPTAKQQRRERKKTMHVEKWK